MLRARRALAEHHVELEVLERRIQDLLDRAAASGGSRRRTARRPSSRLVRIAARSPGRSSAGPDVGWNPTPISLATICGERGLAQPGRPAEQQVVDGLAARSGPVDQERELFLDPVLPDELVERRGRSATSNSRSSSGTWGSTIRSSWVTSVVTLPPTHLLQRLSQEILDVASPSACDARVIASLASCWREPERQQRLAHVGERAVDDHDSSAPSLSRRSRTTRCATFLPTPGTTVSAPTSPAETARRNASGAEHREEAQRDLRPDAAHAGEQVEQLALVRVREPEQGHRVVAHDHARVHAGGTAHRRELRERRRGHQHVVADAADRDHDARARPSRRRRPRGTRSSRGDLRASRAQP